METSMVIAIAIALVFCASLYFFEYKFLLVPTSKRMENAKIKSSESFLRHQADKKVTTSSSRSNALQMAMDF